MLPPMNSDPQQKKIRVLHVLQALGVGGAERRVLRLASGLDPARYEVHALTLRERDGPALAWPPERHRHFPIAPGIHPRRLWALARLIRRERFDVVHSHNWATMFYGVLAGRLGRAPVVLHGEHGRNAEDREHISPRRELLAAALARMATRVVAVNAAIADDLRGRWGSAAAGVVCIPNGVDTRRFRPQPRGAGRDHVIGTIARFDAVKNLPSLVRAFERLCAARPDLSARLLLVGDGPDLEAVKAQAAASPAAARIEFPGPTDAPEDWYPRFDTFVNCSFNEGMSNSVLEAMACGLPVVASAIAGHLCWLEDGRQVLFYPSDDAEAMAQCLARLALDRELAARMGAANRRQVEAEYDNQDFLGRYDALYKRLLGR